MTIEALQKRIKTTEDLRSIVSTMKALSSVSILQYEQANRALKKYRDNLSDAFQALVLSQGLPEVIKEKSAPRYLFILIGSDSGLVGRFNKEVIEQTSDWLKSNNINISDVWFITIGKRIAALAEQKHLKIFAKYASANSVKVVNSIAETLIIKIDEATRKQHINNIHILYHKRGKSTSVSLEHQTLIPFNYEKMKNLSKKKWPTNNLVQTDLKRDVFFSEIINQILGISLVSFLNFSLAAEHFIRMTNMQAAEKNIDENLEEMNLAFQQQRQEEITGELIDIVAGYQAM